MRDKAVDRKYIIEQMTITYLFFETGGMLSLILEPERC